MEKTMLIDCLQPEEIRIAFLEDKVLEEFYVEHTESGQMAGNVFKGVVANIEKSLQAAFIELGDTGVGNSKNGFLHFSDIMPSAVGLSGSRKSPAQIVAALKPSQEITVQVTKEAMGKKGPSLTTYLSLPGRYLVLMPGIRKHGVSRKLTDQEERERLRRLLEEIDPPKDLGFIIRTAGQGQTKRNLARDLGYLLRLYSTILKRIRKAKAPALIYQESDLVIRAFRDYFTADTKQVIIDSEPVYRRALEFLRTTMPRSCNRVSFYRGKEPLFSKYKLEQEIEAIYSRRVQLSGGGDLVIDETEALVAIDVNSGRYRRERTGEETAYQTNMKATVEIARHIRLRDLGGLIVIDFIDMHDEKHVRDVEKSIADSFKRDRARLNMSRMSRFGIVEMTRQRVRPGPKKATYIQCPHCDGTGLIKSARSICLAIMRRIGSYAIDQQVETISVTCHPEVNFYLQNRRRAAIIALESTLEKRVDIAAGSDHRIDHFEFRLFDKGGRELKIPGD